MTLPITAVEPALTVKVELALKFKPLPERVQSPKVVAEPKVNPEVFCTEPTVIVLVTGATAPKKVAVSPEVQGERVVPSRVQKLSVPQVPLPDW